MRADLPEAIRGASEARDSGKRVELLSRRTETATTFVNPDGTLTTETASAPVRVRSGSGGWSPIDLTLVRRADGLAPKAAVGDVRLSDGGDGELASVSTKGRRLALRWPGRLPEPTVEGDTAVYPGVLRNVDMVLQAKRTGFEQSLVLRERPAGQLVYRLPLALPGITAEPQADGGYTLVDDSGAVVGVVPQPAMYGAEQDPVTGDPVRAARLDVKIVSSASGTEMQVKPDMEFLADPALRYPVTLDPDLHLGIVADTWVSSNTTLTYGTAPDLRSGKYGGTGAIQRSLIKFDTAPIAGAVVSAATLALYNNQSASCDQTKQTRVYALGGPFSNSTTYANRPGVDTSLPFVTATGSYAGPTCGAGFIRWNVLQAAQRWATGGANYGLTVVAADENDTANWKRYASADNGSNSYVPSLAVTFNTAPATATGVAVEPCDSGCAEGLTNTTEPVITAVATDRDGAPLRFQFEVSRAADGAVVAAGLSEPVMSGTRGSYALPPGRLTVGTDYSIRVRAYDGQIYGAWSSTRPLKVDDQPPAAPRVSSAEYPPSDVVTAAPAQGPGTFRFDGDAETAEFKYDLDGEPAGRAAASAGSAQVSIDPGPGEHVLSVRATDKAGNDGPRTEYVFVAGPAPLDRVLDQAVAPAAVRPNGRQYTPSDTPELTARVAPGGASEIDFELQAEQVQGLAQDSDEVDAERWGHVFQETAPTAADGSGSVRVPEETLDIGGVYRFRSRAKEGTAVSDWTDWDEFSRSPDADTVPAPAAALWVTPTSKDLAAGPSGGDSPEDPALESGGGPADAPEQPDAAPTGTVITLQPTFGAAVSDPDGGVLTARFTVRAAGGGTVATGRSAVSPSGGVATWRAPAGALQDGLPYEWSVAAEDGNTSGAPSSWQPFDVRLPADGPPTDVIATETYPDSISGSTDPDAASAAPEQLVFSGAAADAREQRIRLYFEVKPVDSEDVLAAGYTDTTPAGQAGVWAAPPTIDPQLQYRYTYRATDGTSTTLPRTVLTSNLLIPDDGGISPTRTNDRSKTVLLLHGLSIALNPANGSTPGLSCTGQFNRLRNFMREKGYNDIRTLAYYESDRNCTDNIGNHGSHFSYYSNVTSEREHERGGPGHTNHADIRHLAYHLAWYIYDTQTSRGRSVDVIAHSMGGLILRYAISRVQRGDPYFPSQLRVEDAITVGTPHTGAHYNLPKLGGCRKTQCKQLYINSDFLKKLKRDAQNPQGTGGTQWSQLGSTADGLVSATSATAMSGAHKWTWGSGQGYTNYGHGEYFSAFDRRNAFGFWSLSYGRNVGRSVGGAPQPGYVMEEAAMRTSW